MAVSWLSQYHLNDGIAGSWYLELVGTLELVNSRPCSWMFVPPEFGNNKPNQTEADTEYEGDEDTMFYFYLYTDSSPLHSVTI